MNSRRPKSLLATIVATIALMTVMVMPASAITDGELDGDGHPYVGIMVAQTADGIPLWRCTGTLLSDTLFLTAGHCTEAPAEHVEIWFSAGPIPLGAGYPAAGPNPCAGVTGYPCTGDVSGTPHTHPQYDPNAFFLYDLGVVELHDAFASPNGVYGVLPELNQLDDMKPGKRSTFTAVGYGLQKSFPDAAGWKDVGERTRYVAKPHLLQINNARVADFAVILSANASTGGTCFGDSGGPNFIGDSNVIAGVTSFGVNSTCAGTSGVYRVDQADDLNWLWTEFGDHLS